MFNILLAVFVFINTSEAIGQSVNSPVPSIIKSKKIPSDQIIKQDNYTDKLKSFPGLAPSIIQQNIAPSSWETSDDYVYKGKVLKVISQGTEPVVFRIYNKKDKRINPSYLLKGTSLFKDEIKICSKPEHNFSIGLIEVSSKRKCPIDIGFLSRSTLKVKEISTTFAELDTNGEKLFIDVEFCYKNKTTCEIEDRVFSKFEMDWVELMKQKIAKSNSALNFYIDHLLPCVKSKDIKCLNKYVVTQDLYDSRLSNEGAGEPLAYRNLSSVQKFEELANCLKYENLLTHMKASKGKNFICIFNVDNISIALPSDLDVSNFGITCPDKSDCMEIYPLP